ncbi:glycosyltransferase family 2 protein [uncultured Microbacterium sp.]|uniref:4,4'-diaponeurosporenoate glycosyltransferase n=1 Tax=uncultured Microbacterium sp. TaxID=191216 RepID=A0A1Y5P0B1_9MICO|nr:glycosyltransferase [uncultured Microbacterium sp.]SBS72065.1 Glycosyl transferase [uncultured Microbacterium sp.]
MTRRIDAVAVVIPAHDEEELLGACLDSVAVAVLAAQAVVERVDVHVVLDACTDGSARIAAAAGVPVTAIDARAVGVARAAGIAQALAALPDHDLRRIWTAHTDADSVVPPNWITHQLVHARRGADLVIGTVRPDFADLSPEQTAAWWATHTPGVANGHVHGANLGIRASALIGVGGFPPAPAHEDVRVAELIRQAGGRVVATDAAWVSTSGRREGRAPEGYARYLQEGLLDRARRIGAPDTREISLL